jgi:putative ABC transport system permease protein
VWTIALKTLLSDRSKLLTALLGVVFAVVLVNVQGGLFMGLIRKASLLVEQGSADVWVGHRKMHNVDFPHEVPRRWVHRIKSIPGVSRAVPYLVGHSVMTLPDGGFEPVLVIGCDPTTLVGSTNAAFGCDPAAIRQADGVIVDRCDADKLGNPQLGDLREIGRRRARVVDFSEGVLGFLVTPYVFTTIDRAAEYLDRPNDEASYFLVQLAPGADIDAVCATIKERLPEVEAYSRNEYAQLSIAYWMQRTGLGISFGAATALGLLVGLAIVAQTLYASVLDRLAEFGALKAIGAGELQIFSIVLTQAFALALVGSALGLATVMVVQTLCSSPRAPIEIPWVVSGGSVLLVVGICLAASTLPYVRMRAIDPALVLQG